MGQGGVLPPPRPEMPPAAPPPLSRFQAVVKALEQLAQQGKIKEKMYGKQKIYFADQVRTTRTDDRLRVRASSPPGKWSVAG